MGWGLKTIVMDLVMCSYYYYWTIIIILYMVCACSVGVCSTILSLSLSHYHWLSLSLPLSLLLFTIESLVRIVSVITQFCIKCGSDLTQWQDIHIMLLTCYESLLEFSVAKFQSLPENSTKFY